MRAQTVLSAIVAALACLGVTEAIKCYSCIYADDYEGPIPPEFIYPSPAQDSRCGSSLGEGITAGTYPDTSEYPFQGFAVPGTRNFTSNQVYDIQKLTKLFQAPESTETKVGAPYKVYCAKISGDVGGSVGYLTARLLVARDDLIVRDGCANNQGMRVCTCSDDECNSASGIQLSLSLIAVTLIGKFIF